MPPPTRPPIPGAPGPPVNAAAPLKLWEAIAREEGFYVLHSRAQRNNNPGNLEYGSFTVAHGAVSSDGRFAIFDSPSNGFQALRVLLAGPVYASCTLEEWAAKYAPSNENNTNEYLENVYTWCHANAGTLVSSLL